MRCWAESLGNCSNKISKEHIISKSILDNPVTVKGFSWCKNERKEIGINSLVVKKLCEKHNNQLSIFDTEIKKFNEAINFINYNRENISYLKKNLLSFPIEYNINGQYIEKWLCKTLLNIYFINKNNQFFISENILPKLFNKKNFKEPNGLYFVSPESGCISSLPIEIEPIFYRLNSKKEEIIGARFKFQGLYLILIIPISINFSFESLKNGFLNNSNNWFNNYNMKRHLRIIQNEVSIDGRKLISHRIKFSWNQDLL